MPFPLIYFWRAEEFAWNKNKKRTLVCNNKQFANLADYRKNQKGLIFDEF